MLKNHFDGRIYLISNTHNDAHFTQTIVPNQNRQTYDHATDPKWIVEKKAKREKISRIGTQTYNKL